jgi:CHASE2 domain-containing sensor protein
VTNPQAVYVQYAPKPPSNGLAIAGLVLGIVALVTALIPLVGWFFAFVPAVLAVVFGHIAHASARRTGLRKGESVTAWVTGYLALLLRSCSRRLFYC